MKRHPNRQELMAYAENLVDGRNPISAQMGSHIAVCPACSAEVEAMRLSFAVTRSAPSLEPSGHFTAQLLLAAKNERRIVEAHRVRQSVLSAVKGIGYGAGFVAVCAVCFGLALSRGTAADAVHASVVAASQAISEAAPSPETLRRAAVEVQTLTAAVCSSTRQPANLWEKEHRRAVSTLGADLEAARQALERNPGCARAKRIMDTTLQRQAQTLKTLYVERSL